jgi:CBS domain-containing protein
MRCSDLMKTSVRWLGPDARVIDAAVLMRDAKVGFIPICDGEQRVVGTVTDRDVVVRGIAEGKGAELPLRTIMSTNRLVVCRPQDDIAIAEARMAEAHVSRIVCVDDQFHLRGVFSLSDLAQSDRDHAVDTLRAVARREVRAF